MLTIIILLSMALVCLLVGLIVALCLFDADLTTSFYERFGVSLSSFCKDKVVWVTGASSGIGASIAVLAAKNGAKVVLSARRKELLSDVRLKCVNAGAKEDHILVLPLDMCDFSSHNDAVDSVLESFSVIDVIIHSAGRSQRARWEKVDIEVDRSLFELNVFSIVNLTRLILPHMREAEQGSVAIMSSIAGKLGAPFSGTYSGTKFALHGYFESLRNEIVGSNISITMLCPGPTFSDVLQNAATEKVGQDYGMTLKKGKLVHLVGDRLLSTERCAEICLNAIANKIGESWMGLFPIIPMTCVAQYLPTIYRQIMSVIGLKLAAKMADSRDAMKSDKLK